MHIKPKKYLGQNFLIDKNIQRKIIDTCGLKTSDIVLEVGAGRGELTQFITDKVDKVYALEIDDSLCRGLKDRFKNYKNVKIIHQDILKFNLGKYFSDYKDKLKVIGNIPYYITTPIIEHLFKYRNKIEAIFITVQKEVAQRMIAKAGAEGYGSFSCFVQYYTQPKIIFLIKKSCFYPHPKVDSCFVNFTIRQVPIVDLKNEKLFFKIIRAAFGKRRKTLRNSLKGIISVSKLEKFFIKYNVNANIRPERLTLEDFSNLTKI